MGNITLTTQSPTSIPCVVDRTYFPHLFLIPAGIIITILAFLRRRTSFKREIWGGRPGVVVPIDFLGIDNDRIAIMCVFGAATGSIVTLINNKTAGRNAWETAFLGIGTAIEVAFIYYPFFGCLASYHRIIGALMALPYIALYFSISLTADLQECNNIEHWVLFVVLILSGIPSIVCHLLILGKFVFVLYQEIKNYGVHLFLHNNDHASHHVKLTRPWLQNHVKDLIKPKTPRQYSRIESLLRKIYNPEKNFKFSTQTMSVMMICSILLYNISIGLVFYCSYLLENVRKSSTLLKEIADVWRGVLGSMIAATILASIFCVVSFVRIMENHKNNMLRMFKGDKSFIPKNISASQFMIGKGLRYHSYQIGYFLWGYILLLLLFLIIFCGIWALISYKIVQDCIVNFIKGGGVIAGVAVVVGFSLPIASLTIFRDYTYSRDVISINNRNVYLVFSYFWFFIGLPMGFFSAIFRILKATVVGALMLPRIDHSVMPDGFQRFDQGFKAYIGYLHVQTAFRNPILRVFCQILVDETKNKRQRWTCSAQARARWFLALTLARNPQLQTHESDQAPESVQAPESIQACLTKPGDVEIQVGQFGSDVGLISKRS